MAYKVIKITSEDNHGIYYEELGSVSLNYNALSYNEVTSDEQFVHNELSKEVYKFLLKNKSDVDLDNIAVIDNSFSNLSKIIWWGGNKKIVKAKYRVSEIKENKLTWRGFITPGKDSEKLERRIHYAINLNPYDFEPNETIFSWDPLQSFFNLDDALSFVNKNKSSKYWIWHSEFEGKVEVFHIDYWEGEVKENFTERNLWTIILKENEEEEKAFKEKEEKKRQAEEERKRRELEEERKRRAKYIAENPWYYLEDELRDLEEESSELSDKLNNRWDDSAIRIFHNSYWDVDYEEGESKDTLGEDQANKIESRLHIIGNRKKELKKAISNMKESKRAADEKEKQEEYYSKVDNLSNLLKDPVIAKRVEELKRGK